MRTRRGPALLLLLLATLALGACESRDVYSGRVVLDGTHTVAEGQTLDGDLAILGGRTTLEPGSRVTGSVYAVAGELVAGGDIAGDVTALGGQVTLGPSATIQGDLRIGTDTVDRTPGATVAGEVVASEVQVPLSPGWWGDRSPTARAIWFAARTALLAAFAFLLGRSLPGALGRVARAATGQPAVSGALGLLTLVVAPSLLVFMAFTVILIPVAILGFLLLGLLIVWGWVAFGLAAGRYLSGRRDWHLRPGAQAVVGTVLITLAADALRLVPLLGEIALILAFAVGLGAVFLTRFGTRAFVPAAGGDAAGGSG